MKKLIRVILFFFILLFLIYGICYLLLPQKNIKKYGMIKVANNEILGEDKNTIDSIILGDSLVYSGISPMDLWHNYGYTVFDCASEALLTKDAYQNLKIATDNQEAKVVFMEADVLFRDEKRMPRSRRLKLAIKYFFPIYQYHNNWKKYLFSFVSEENKDFIDLNINKGYKLVKSTHSAKKKRNMKKSNKKKSIPTTNLTYFDKIVQLSKEKNIKLILISIPNLEKWSSQKHNRIQSLADLYDLEFIDLNDENVISIDWQKDTRDFGNHLNYRGALKVTHFIGEYLKKNHLVMDHRKDSSYESWNKSDKLFHLK